MKLYLTLPMRDSNPYLVLPESVGRYARIPDHQVEREENQFPFFNLHYIASGAGYVEDAGRKWPVQAGDAFLFFPNRPQRYWTSEDNPWDIYWMHFYGDLLPEFLGNRGFRRSAVWSMKQRDPLEANFKLLLTEVETHNLLRPSVLSTMTYAVLAEFISQAVPQRSRSGHDSLQAMTDLLPAMQEAASEPFLLKGWADQAGVSPHYFCKMFRKANKMTPLEFVTLCRIRQAKQLLLDGRDLSVGEIAETCGYPSASYFIKQFKRHEGVTPAAYRELHA